MMDKSYVDTVRLLLESVPVIFKVPHFAMKGGTAINLFVQDMPRLSVDIDVIYTDHTTPRDIFDVHGLYEQGGLTPEIVECFVCYLVGHNRPTHEALFSNDIDLAPAFENEFVGMTQNQSRCSNCIRCAQSSKRNCRAN